MNPSGTSLGFLSTCDKVYDDMSREHAAIKRPSGSHTPEVCGVTVCSKHTFGQPKLVKCFAGSSWVTALAIKIRICDSRNTAGQVEQRQQCLGSQLAALRRSSWKAFANCFITFNDPYITFLGNLDMLPH